MSRLTRFGYSSISALALVFALKPVCSQSAKVASQFARNICLLAHIIDYIYLV